MIQHVNAVSNRLSLRKPQRDSLEILSQLCEVLPLQKGQDLEQTLEVIKSQFDTVEDFERDFPSLCFALATGVGKTRLMGAFIAYLHRAEGIRHFFVLAPNLTIYNKLIADFTPNTPKYVFQGISEFATTPPIIITGDNYESGIGVRDEYGKQQRIFDSGEVHVNIFNISKINSEVRGGKSPRIKRLSEYIGDSYFDYLAGLDDLVLLMDESHRYRASAGIKAINELKPILGLELTATPQVESGNRSTPFKNVVYSYPLANALDDGYVKSPAVATRENFDPRNYDPAGLEKLKLEDGVRVHEDTKVELEVFARENGKPIVKPFMLVVAQDTEHANAIVQSIESDDFFEGRFKGKVITVHSNLRGEIKDDVVEKLLSVEDPSNPTEIVVHVNMLKEGWDVTNLYTIVPLRAANSKTLVEQSIGRGLRLPYGERMGVPAVDRLTIVSHDRFQEIVDEANSPDSIIKTGLYIGKDIAQEKARVVVVEPNIEQQVAGSAGEDGQVQGSLFEKPEERKVAKEVLAAIRDYERLPRSNDLQKPETQQELVDRVTASLAPSQYEIEGTGEAVDVESVVKETIAAYITKTIDIPKIVVEPSGEVTCGFRDFDLDVSNINYPPVERDILIQHLDKMDQRYKLVSGDGVVEEDRLENYIVRGLIDFDEINYDQNSELLYKLAGQVVQRLQSYLDSEDDVLNVLQYHQQPLVNLVRSQMLEHYEESASEYVATISRGFTTLRPGSYSLPEGEEVRDYRTPIQDRSQIRRMLFGGFEKCVYPAQRFDVDTERRFAAILETDENVEKWFKPSKGSFQIHYKHDAAYEPDFVVETEDAKYICEPKRSTDINDDDVLAKAKAAATWCEHASRHELEHRGKQWKYLLIPHDAISDNMTLQGLTASYEFRQVSP